MFRLSTPEVEGPFNGSKWLQVQVMLDSQEIRDLFQEMGEFLIVPVGCVVEKQHSTISKEEFFKAYDLYVNALKKGQEPNPRDYIGMFSCAISVTEDSFYAIDVPGSKLLVKPVFPVIQMQSHSMVYSIVDEQIYPMVRGPDSINWGIQFAYPTLFQHKKSYEPSSTLYDEGFPNTPLFQVVQKWMRRHTRPVPIMIRQKTVNLSVRIGHQCFSWINNHPHLRFHGLVVENEGDEG